MRREPMLPGNPDWAGGVGSREAEFPDLRGAGDARFGVVPGRVEEAKLDLGRIGGRAISGFSPIFRGASQGRALGCVWLSTQGIDHRKHAEIGNNGRGPPHAPRSWT